MENTVYPVCYADSKTKKSYIEYLRALAAVTIVFLHIVMTLPANYSITELGILNSAVFNALYMPTKWAVPCFFMISGALLLDPKKRITIDKIWDYIKRMLWVLLIFGTGFALMELVFSEKTIKLTMLFKALLNVAEGKTWDHLWYLYVLIALYIITIPLKYVIERMPQKELRIFAAVLIIGNFIIPSINAIAGTEIKGFMIFNEYATYFILGYLLETSRCKIGKKVIIPAVAVTLVMVVTDVMCIYNNESVFVLNHQSKDILTLIQASCVFLFFKQCFSDKKCGTAIKAISNCSFAIYLIHPFWINLFYKAFKFTPLSMPIWGGVPVLFIMVFILSLGTAIILKRIPWIKRII